jgi:predicted MFS family arabinose efflux permease
LPLLLSVPERPRENLRAHTETTRATIASLLRDPRLVMVWLAGMTMMASGFGFSTWAPSYFVRERGMDVAVAGQLFGLSLLVGGVVGSVLGGMLADRARKRRLAGELDVSALAALAAIPLALGTLVLDWQPGYMAAAVLAPVAVFAFFPSLQTVILEVVAPHHHGVAYALNILFLAGIGLAIGPYVVGAVSDVAGLGTAMFVPVAGMALAAVLIATAGGVVRAKTPVNEPSVSHGAPAQGPVRAG